MVFVQITPATSVTALFYFQASMRQTLPFFFLLLFLFPVMHCSQDSWGHNPIIYKEKVLVIIYEVANSQEISTSALFCS